MKRSYIFVLLLICVITEVNAKDKKKKDSVIGEIIKDLITGAIIAISEELIKSCFNSQSCQQKQCVCAPVIIITSLVIASLISISVIITCIKGEYTLKDLIPDGKTVRRAGTTYAGYRASRSIFRRK